MPQVETELKYLITASEYSSLMARLGQDGCRPSSHNQTNHYFDTPDFSLQRQGITLRIRTKEATAVITCKLPLEEEQGSNVSRREEYESLIPLTMAERIITQGLTQEVLGQVLPDLAETLRIPRGGLTCFGQMETTRNSIWYCGLTAPILIDRSTYLGITDHEVEWELDEPEVQAAQLALALLFEETGIVPQVGKVSKANRFFLQLARDPAGQRPRV